jgi:hypothetical protein
MLNSVFKEEVLLCQEKLQIVRKYIRKHDAGKR